jgi:hypothetical protein
MGYPPMAFLFAFLALLCHGKTMAFLFVNKKAHDIKT